MNPLLQPPGNITPGTGFVGSGLTGTSGTFAAALWKVDLSFEFATAGVTGINFHWSFGGLPTNAGLPDKIAPYAGVLILAAAFCICYRGC